MPHRHPEEIMVDLNKLNDTAVAKGQMHHQITAALERLEKEIDAALRDENLSEQELQGYQQALDAWNGHERAINREREEIEESIGTHRNAN